MDKTQKIVEYYQAFEHYDALALKDTSHEERCKVYKMMEDSGIINVPNSLEDRTKLGKFPMKCDFFISKNPSGKKTSWVATRSPEKMAKFTYRDLSYFVNKLHTLNGTSAGFIGVKRDTTFESILDKQIKSMNISSMLSGTLNTFGKRDNTLAESVTISEEIENILLPFLTPDTISLKEAINSSTIHDINSPF
jgi:hypothetical protein